MDRRLGWALKSASCDGAEPEKTDTFDVEEPQHEQDNPEQRQARGLGHRDERPRQRGSSARLDRERGKIDEPVALHTGRRCNPSTKSVARMIPPPTGTFTAPDAAMCW
jgi:hypothetical protein